MNPATVIASRLAAGFAFSAAIGFLAYRRRSLSRSGIAGAVITGTLIFGFGGLMGGLMLIAFFVSSSLLSHYKENRKAGAAEKFDKTGQRDLGQALANGGAAAAFAVVSGLALLAGQPGLAAACQCALVCALASANADTWATEIGVLSRQAPRLITHPGRVVEPGTSGGITSLGTTAALAGAAFIGLSQWVLNLAVQPAAGAGWLASSVVWYNQADPAPGLAVMTAAAIGGLAGSLFDSLLGATVQAIYFDALRNKSTEKVFARDGSPNRLARGWRWLNNDWVNFIASLAGAAIGALMLGIHL